MAKCKALTGLAVKGLMFTFAADGLSSLLIKLGIVGNMEMVN